MTPEDLAGEVKYWQELHAARVDECARLTRESTELAREVERLREANLALIRAANEYLPLVDRLKAENALLQRALDVGDFRP